MRIAYHLGAHCTDDERLLRCLLKNRGLLAAEGIAVPGPARYRNLIRDTAIGLQGQPAPADTQAAVLDQILDGAAADRIVMSWENFLAFPTWALKGTLYPAAGERVRGMAGIFPEADCEVHLAIRNPATFLPALLEKQRGKSYDAFMGGIDPLEVFWSDVVADIVEQNPGVPLTVWCDEDSPLIWPEVLQAVSGHAATTVLTDTDDLLRSIMTADGFRRMQAYLDRHPPRNARRRQRVVSAFLDRFALPDRIDVAIDLPGWTADLVEALTAQYDQDVAQIAALPGVTLLGA